MRNLYPTKAQIEAARRNGAKSRGPLSPETRAKSALNARKHGLTGKTVLLPDESGERLQAIYDDLYAEFQPQTISEFFVFEDMVAAVWRKLRARGIEQNCLAKELAKEPGLSVCDAWTRSHDARLAVRYETAHRRAFDSARRELLSASFLRLAVEAAEENDAKEAKTSTPEFPIEPNTPQTQEEKHPQ